VQLVLLEQLEQLEQREQREQLEQREQRELLELLVQQELLGQRVALETDSTQTLKQSL